MINTNTIIKMKIVKQSKPKLKKTAHYYLCWDNNKNKNKFFVFTSNFIKLFGLNIANPDDIVVIQPSDSLPFNKETILVLSESYNVQKLQEPQNYYKQENAFSQNNFDKYKTKGKFANQILVDGYSLI